MNELDRFFQLFINSLQDVHQSYYETVYANLSALRGAFPSSSRFRDNDFIKFSERVFCYELYHHLRKKYDEEKVVNPLFLGNAKIQGELQKTQITELLRHYGLRRLTRDFIPDILVHTPGNAEYHPFIIEVKCMPDVSRSEIWYDIDKINQFITKFRYLRGVFLSVNTQVEYLNNIIVNLSPGIERLDGCEGIRVVCKPSQNTTPTIWGMREGNFQIIDLNDD